jgi:mannosyltransferase OCH1-like enzyme
MIPRKIHQIFIKFKEGRSLEDIPIFVQQISKTTQYCQINDIIYKLWNEEDCNELINRYPQYKLLYDNFREEIQKIDFIRYLILYDEGGIYVDCDVAPIGDINILLDYESFFVRWNDDKKQLPYNAVLGSVPKSELYEDIFKQIHHDYDEKIKIKTYETWKGRFVFQTTGHHMLNRVLKNYPDIPKLDILKIYGKGGDIIGDVCPIFEDYNASIWYPDPNGLYEYPV